MRNTTRRILVTTLVAAGCAAAPVAAVADSGQSANAQSPLLRGVPGSSCVAGGVPGTDSGVVVVHENAVQNVTHIHLELRNGLPDTTYYVAIRCIEYVGTFTTNDQGFGVFNTDVPGLHPEAFITGIDSGPVANPDSDYRASGPLTQN